MHRNAKSRYFDARAESWNERADTRTLARVIETGIRNFVIRKDEVILDLGCGTGTLTRALLEHLSTEGRVIAVDFAPCMLTRAKRTIADPRVTWLCNDARNIQAPDRTVDRVIAFSAWPHFDRPVSVIAEIRRLLRDNGKLHIWHKESREKVNAVHARCGFPVCADTLPPAHDTARALAAGGFAVLEVVDDAERYLVSAAKI
jgi:ubiquinone/menaquinone biosynthesis C-methylase UbiE